MSVRLPVEMQNALDAIRPWPAPQPIPLDEYGARLDRARTLLAVSGQAALLLGPGASLRYFTGLAWTLSERLTALVLPVEGEAFLVCPAFERGTIERMLSLPIAVRCWHEHEDPAALVAAALPPAAVLALDPDLPFRFATQLQRLGKVQLASAAPVIDGCRGIKSAAESALIQQAMSMTLAVHRLVHDVLTPGLTASQIRIFIDLAHRAMGAADGSSFCAVQFGEATCFPHGVPGEQTLGARDLVLVDTGCILLGYHSDITRTYAFGAPDPEHARIWNIEREAQLAAFAAIRPGTCGEDVDAAARTVLQRHGLGPAYALPGLPHRTGHGIGASIHEAPYIVPGDRTVLAPGMCFSIEPMIVLPGQFGIRLEDHVIVTDQGARWFTEPACSIGSPFA